MFAIAERHLLLLKNLQCLLMLDVNNPEKLFDRLAWYTGDDCSPEPGWANLVQGRHDRSEDRKRKECRAGRQSLGEYMRVVWVRGQHKQEMLDCLAILAVATAQHLEIMAHAAQTCSPIHVHTGYHCMTSKSRGTYPQHREHRDEST